MCIRGASEVQKKVLEKVTGDDLRVHAVYAPILGSDTASTIAKAATHIPDPRVMRYRDGKGELVFGYAPVLGLGENPAWDVYLLYGPEAEWKDKPPAPTSWMHQLQAGPGGRELDGERLAAEAAALVGTIKKGGTK